MGIWNTLLTFSSLYPGVIPHHNILSDVAIRHRLLVHRLPTQAEVFYFHLNNLYFIFMICFFHFLSCQLPTFFSTCIPHETSDLYIKEITGGWKTNALSDALSKLRKLKSSLNLEAEHSHAF